MRRFRVWAPSRRKVELCSGGRRNAMSAAPGGWWEFDDAGATSGARYAFCLDGGEPRPDPRSPSQPDGVLGWSALVDHDTFRWTDGEWRGFELDGAVIYEMHTGTFSREGTFDGAIAHLGHLVDLGVDALEIMPVAEFSGDRGWGYDGVDLFAPHHAYGGPDGLKRLVDACHGSGLGVILDVVYNHVGPVGNFLGEFGPYFSDRHRTAWGDAFNFDGDGSEEVRRFVIDNALTWIRDYHFDGLRLDAVHAIADVSPVHILEELGKAVHELGDALGRSTLVIAESDANDPRLVRGAEAGGCGLDAVWSDDWHHSLHALLTGERTGYYEDFGDAEHLAKALRQAWVYDGQWSPHRRRIRGARTDGLEPKRFVIAAQNHDQVGNRATGDRLAGIAREGELKAAATLLLTSPFVAMLFQGEEWAASTPFLFFTDHADQRLGHSVAEGRRREFAAFGWDPREIPDPQDPRTFERSRLDWDEVDETAHRDMLAWHRDLIRLRRTLRARGPAITVAAGCENRYVAFDRDGLRVRVNLGDEPWRVEVGENVRVVLASAEIERPAGGLISIPPESVAVLEQKPST